MVKQYIYQWITMINELFINNTMVEQTQQMFGNLVDNDG